LTEIRGILFDKDGTLLDFNSIWVPAANCMIDKILYKYSKFDNTIIRNKLLQSIGIEGENISGQGILASGTVFDIADAFANVFRNEKIEVFETIGFKFTWADVWIICQGLKQKAK
jgi:phosphoglycolate phosphatase-like HAD superfamily hydrolase